MKQIKRFSPHQTAKVVAVLMAIGSLPMFIPMILISMFTMPLMDAQGSSSDFFGLSFFFLIFPIFYLIIGYISIWIGCWLYNIMYRFVGGFEFELADVEKK